MLYSAYLLFSFTLVDIALSLHSIGAKYHGLRLIPFGATLMQWDAKQFG